MLTVADDSTIGRLLAVVAQVAAQHNIKTDIAPTDSLVDRGMTSMAMVDLMLAIEVEFDVTIPQREMTPANFQTIASLATMLERL